MTFEISPTSCMEEINMRTSRSTPTRFSRRHFVVAAASSVAALSMSHSATAATLNQLSTNLQYKENPMNLITVKDGTQIYF